MIDDGNQLVDDLWFEVREFVPEEKRQELARKFINISREHGVDEWTEDLLVEEDANLSYEDEDEEESDEDLE